MFIGHDNFRDLFQEYEPSSYTGGEPYCVFGYEMLKDAAIPYSAHVLYIVPDASELKEITPIRDMNLLILNCSEPDQFSDFEEALNITAISTKDLPAVKRKLRDFYNLHAGSGLLSETLLGILSSGRGIQAMVDSFVRAFNNPLFVFDAGFHLIAANWDMIECLEMDQRIVKNMGFTEQEYALLNRNQNHAKVLKSETPLRIHNNEYGYDQMLCAISTKKDIGHIVLSATNRPFNDTDELFLIMFRQAVCLQLEKEEAVRNSSGQPYEHLLKDLLDQRISTDAQLNHRLEYINTSFTDSLFCMVIDLSLSDKVINTFILRDIFDEFLPNTKSLMYNGKLVLLFCLDNASSDFSEADYAQLNKICQEEKIYAGLSSHFSNLLLLSEFFRQAESALKAGAGNKKPGLFRYKEYYFSDILHSFAKEHNIDNYCHPGLRQLLDYDAKNHSDLAHTLYMFLLNERNLQATADALFIHRNTMKYRMSRISEISGFDYSDVTDRMNYIISYRLLML